MAEQTSKRGNAITESPIEAAFTTPVYPMGGGLNLVKAIDALAPGEFARLTNVFSDDTEGTRQFQGRPGLTALGTTPSLPVHSLSRVDLPLTSSFIRFAGSGVTLARGTSGAFTLADNGYSGGPLSLLAHRTAATGDPWVYVGDTARNRKVRASDGLVMPIGLPAPANAATTALAAENKTTIANFSTDGTQVANWTPNAGMTYDTPPVPTEVPEVIAITGPGGAPGIDFGALATIPLANGSANQPNGYYVFWGCPKTMNLNLVGGLPATDDDYFHTYVYFSHTDHVEEVRVYLVCSATFSPSILPGIPGGGGANTDAYVKSWAGNPLATFVNAAESQLSSSEVARVKAIRDKALKLQDLATRELRLRAQLLASANKLTAEADALEAQLRANLPRPNLDVVRAQTDLARTITQISSPASETYQEYGIVGVPVRRGDFQRIGSTSGRDWSTITGIIVFVKLAPDTGTIATHLADMYLTGGAKPDTGDPQLLPYDYRYTHYDPRTGAEGNPSPEMARANWQDTLRRNIVVTPTAYGDSAVRQRFYRRGGSISGDWYFAGENTSDGGALTDANSDLEIVAAGTVELDHYQAVPSVSSAGVTILAQPCTVYFGPYNGQIYALGDPNRPGYVYACVPGEPDHWPPDLAYEVCPPNEQLLAGLMFGGQPYAFSRERLHVLYPNQTGAAGLSSQPTGCTRGLAGALAWCVGGGHIWFISQDGVYHTTGGGQEKLTFEIDPIFLGQTVHGYLPVNFANERALRCAFFENELYVQYADTGGTINVLVYSPAVGDWRHYEFAQATSALVAENGGSAGTNLLLGANGDSAIYLHDGLTDLGTSIQGRITTGAWDWGRPREEKLFGDQILDANLQGLELTWTNRFNADTEANAPVVVTGAVGRQRYIFDAFGTTGPQRARNLSVDLAWEAAADPPVFYFVGTALTPQPDLTVNRVTNWDDLGSADESYLTGVVFDVDTQGVGRTIIIERDFAGAISTVATLQVLSDGRHKLRFSWPAVQANQVRVRPSDDCLAWILYRADWIAQPEPPRIARWDVHFENGWDQYYTGLDLYCDTGGAQKRIQVEVDGVVLDDPSTGNPYFLVTTAGRQVAHLTLPWGRGHVFHVTAIDDYPGLLYAHKWHLIEEPSEQTNWNQPFTIMGTAADKWLKAVVFEVDTFGEDKSVRVEVDGALLDTLTVNADGRKVVQIALPQVLGRVFRFFPSDDFPSRLYSLRPVFDEEPFALTRWETQEITHGIHGFQTPIDALLTLKSSEDVTLELTIYLNQGRPGQDPIVVTDTYLIPATNGIKSQYFLPFEARKGVLFKWLFTCPGSFWFYREESQVTIQPWQGGGPVTASPFGNSDNDTTRSMVNAELAAGRSGGGTN